MLSGHLRYPSKFLSSVPSRFGKTQREGCGAKRGERLGLIQPTTYNLEEVSPLPQRRFDGSSALCFIDITLRDCAPFPDRAATSKKSPDYASLSDSDRTDI